MCIVFIYYHNLDTQYVSLSKTSVYNIIEDLITSVYSKLEDFITSVYSILEDFITSVYSKLE